MNIRGPMPGARTPGNRGTPGDGIKKTCCNHTLYGNKIVNVKE